MTVPATQPARLHAALQKVIEGLKAYDPEQIVLFGSLARGDASEHSDIDLIVIKDTDLPRQERRSECADHLPTGLGIGVDVIVYTPREVEGMLDRRSPFLAAAFTDGVVVYDRNSIPGAPSPKSRLKEPTMESRLRNGHTWLETAVYELRICRLLLTSETANGACFHAQQTAEKAFKAFIFYCGLLPKRIHSVKALAQECAEQDPDFLGYLAEADLLSRYYTDTRYAEEGNGFIFQNYELLEAQRAVQAAQRVLTFVQSKVPPRPQQ